MADIKLKYDNDLMECDINYDTDKKDLEYEYGLETAVLISLFTDRRASDDDDYWNDDKRGWWGSNLQANEFEQGSKLWILERAKTTTENLRLAEDYSKEALLWMIEDNICKKIEVVAERDNEFLKLHVKIFKEANNESAITYEILWDAQFEDQ